MSTPSASIVNVVLERKRVILLVIMTIAFFVSALSVLAIAMKVTNPFDFPDNDPIRWQQLPVLQRVAVWIAASDSEIVLVLKVAPWCLLGIWAYLAFRKSSSASWLYYATAAQLAITVVDGVAHTYVAGISPIIYYAPDGVSSGIALQYYTFNEIVMYIFAPLIPFGFAIFLARMQTHQARSLGRAR